MALENLGGLVVLDGDFSLGTSGWIPGAGGVLTTDTEPCGLGIGTLRNTSGEPVVAADQCIRLAQHGTDWTLLADIGVATTATAARVAVLFYNSDDCSGVPPRLETIGPATTVGGLVFFTNSFSYDTQAAGIQSIRARLATEPTLHLPGTGCFDNVSLSADGALLVDLHSFEAGGLSPAPWLLAIPFGLALGLWGTIAARRRRR